MIKNENEVQSPSEVINLFAELLGRVYNNEKAKDNSYSFTDETTEVEKLFIYIFLYNSGMDLSEFPNALNNVRDWFRSTNINIVDWLQGNSDKYFKEFMETLIKEGGVNEINIPELIASFQDKVIELIVELNSN